MVDPASIVGLGLLLTRARLALGSAKKGRWEEFEKALADLQARVAVLEGAAAPCDHVSPLEIGAFLEARGFAAVPLASSAVEKVYGKRVDEQSPQGWQLSLRVHLRSSQSDAIRVSLVWRDPAPRLPHLRNRPVVKARRVEPTAAWQDQLDARLEEVIASLPPPCPECGRPMQERNSDFGTFWGCTAYPTCRGKRQP